MDHYKTLGLSPDATIEEVKIQFRRLSKIYHPDVTRLPEQEALRRSKEINAAFEAITSRSLHRPQKTPSPTNAPRSTSPVASQVALDALVRSILPKHSIPVKLCGRLCHEDKQCLVFYDWAGGPVIDGPISFLSSGGPVVYFDWKRATMSAMDVLRKWNCEFPEFAIPEGKHAGRPKAVAAGVLNAMRILKDYHDDPESI